MSEMENVVANATEEEKVEVGENKHEKFYRITEKRIQNAAKYIEMLSNCASSDYEYTEEDVAKMFDYLQMVLDETKAKYDKREIAVFNW